MEGKLTVFDPMSQTLFPASSLQDQTTYFAGLEEADDTSWLAGKIDPVRSFSNLVGKDVTLYKIRFDGDFR